jgi:hypothetical protein
MNILEETDDEFIFPAGSLIPGVDNVITIVQVRVYQFLDLPSSDVLPAGQYGPKPDGWE